MPQLDTRHAVLSAVFAVAILFGVATLAPLTPLAPTPVVDAHGTAATGGTQNPGDLLGYAWSSTFGWISFSCENDSSCAAGNWGVTADVHGPGATGNLSGYAWGSTGGLPPTGLGWVSFLPSSANGPVGVACGAPATYDALNKRLTGYARACIAVDDCVNPTALNAAAGGWDGCIRLDPGPGANEVGLETYMAASGRIDYFDGFAWDGPAVGTGWIDFCGFTDHTGALVLPPGITPDQADQAIESCVHLRVPILTSLPLPLLLANPLSVSDTAPNKTQLTWMASSYTSCGVVQGAAEGFATGGAKSGSDWSDDLPLGDTTFQIECTDSSTGITNLSNPVTVTAAPVPAPVVIPGAPSGTFTVTPIRVRAGGQVRRNGISAAR